MTIDWTPYTQPDPSMEGSLKLDLSGISPYPMVANPDHSPTNDAFTFPDTFDRAYLADSYTSRPDYSLDDWVNMSLFDRPLTSVEIPADLFSPKNANAVLPNNATSPATASSTWLAMNPSSAPFGRLANLNDAFVATGTAHPFGSIRASPRAEASPTPSLCGDGPLPTSPVRSLKRESPSDAAEEEPTPKKVQIQRKRGRPRLNRSSIDSAAYVSSTGSSPKARPNRRLPHNQVERKYREGLNSELERLRRAVPTLPQWDENDLVGGPPKPSKATVLATAIEYIKKIERERELLIEENERLRGMRASNVGNMRYNGWTKARSNSSSSSFAMDF